jgi:two-component system, LuxR family, response regulator FixJ
MTEPAPVHVIDDDDAVRDALRFLFESAGLAVRTYESAAAFVAAAGNQTGGCVLTDVRMPGFDGIALLRRLAELGADLPVIVMTGHADVPLAVQALKEGAVDFIEKPFDDERLLNAVRAALEAGRRRREEAAGIDAIAARLASLTPREREVLGGLVAGHPNKTIAYDLGSSPRTVEVHRGRVMEKMQARSLAELVRMVLAIEGAGPGKKSRAS